MRRLCRFLFVWINLFLLYGQNEVIILDSVVAVVGEKMILASEVENQYQFLIKNGEQDDGTLRCRILENLITNYLLLRKAELDSLKVTDDQIEAELNRRIGLMVDQAGSVELIEEIYGKSLLELKQELRPKIKEQLLIEQQKQKILGKVHVTPKDVKTFFSRIPKDSLPYLPSEVVIARIVRYPRPSEESKEKLRRKLEAIRQEIGEGKATFEEMARRYSQDLATSEKGGYLGTFGKGEMVPEFEEMVFRLNPGEISMPFETPYGMHIVKLHSRVGNKVEASLILLKFTILPSDEEKCIQDLLRIRELILMDSLTFAEAAKQYSEDPMTKDNGGQVYTSNGEVRIPLDLLDAETYLAIDPLKENEISEPVPFTSPAGLLKGYQILYLIKRYPPHQANLKDDYHKFLKLAKQFKQMEAIDKWMQRAVSEVFLEIRNPDCAQSLAQWYNPAK